MAPSGRTVIKGKHRKEKREHGGNALSLFPSAEGDKREAARALVQGWKKMRTNIELACQSPKAARVRRSTIINGFVRCGYIDKPADAPDDVSEQSDSVDAADIVAALAEHGEIIDRPLTEDMDVVDRADAIESEDEGEEE